MREHQLAIPVGWRLKQEPEEIDEEKRENRDADLGKIILSLDFVLSNDKKIFLESLSTIDDDEIQRIADATVGQRGNILYLKYKKFRLTASNFGYILKAMSRRSYPPSLFGRLLNTSNLDGVSVKFYVVG